MLGINTLKSWITPPEPEPVITPFVMPETVHDMVGARMIYRPFDTRRRVTTEGVVLDVSIHPRGRVWVFVKPLDETMTARWYLATDTLVSYVWN